MEISLILEQLKQYAPAYSLLSAVLVSYIANAVHNYDAKHGNKLAHKKLWVPCVLSLVIVAAMVIAGFFPLREGLWQFILVWGGSSIFYNLFVKKREEEKNG